MKAHWHSRHISRPRAPAAIAIRERQSGRKCSGGRNREERDSGRADRPDLPGEVYSYDCNSLPDLLSRRRSVRVLGLRTRGCGGDPGRRRAGAEIDRDADARRRAPQGLRAVRCHHRSRWILDAGCAGRVARPRRRRVPGDRGRGARRREEGQVHAAHRGAAFHRASDRRGGRAVAHHDDHVSARRPARHRVPRHQLVRRDHLHRPQVVQREVGQATSTARRSASSRERPTRWTWPTIFASTSSRSRRS